MKLLGELRQSKVTETDHWVVEMAYLPSSTAVITLEQANLIDTFSFSQLLE
jgi:hypothetical protein